MSQEFAFEYYGARFTVGVEIVPGEGETAEPPNLRVLEGSWKTWRLVAEPGTSGIEGLRLLRSVDGAGGEHPSGNLTAADSASVGGQVMSSTDGTLYKIATGFGLVSRFYSSSEWQDQLEVWEAALP